MALMGHGTFNSNKIYFVLIVWLTEYIKELGKIAAKNFKKKTIVKDRYFRVKTSVFQNGSNEVLLSWFKFQAFRENKKK